MLNKFKRWTEEEVRYLHESFLHTDDETIAKTLGRTVRAVRAKRHLEGLVEFTQKHWTQEEENFLTAYHKVFSRRTLAKKLNTTVKRVNAKLTVMGLQTPIRDVVNGDIEPFDIYECRPNKTIYALYIGNEYVTDGTVEYLAKYTGLATSTIRYYSSPHSERKNREVRVVKLGRAEEFI